MNSSPRMVMMLSEAAIALRFRRATHKLRGDSLCEVTDVEELDAQMTRHNFSV